MPLLLLDAVMALLRTLIRPHRWPADLRGGVDKIATARAYRRSMALHAHVAGTHDDSMYADDFGATALPAVTTGSAPSVADRRTTCRAQSNPHRDSAVASTTTRVAERSRQVPTHE